MQRPTGVTVLRDGRIAVSDYDNKWISIHEPGGKFISKVGGSRLLGPKGVTVSNTGELIVVDNKASCVHVLQPSGKLVTKFGSRGSEMDQLAGPHYAAVNSLGNIIISDFHNHNIKVGLRFSYIQTSIKFVFSILLIYSVNQTRSLSC